MEPYFSPPARPADASPAKVQLNPGLLLCGFCRTVRADSKDRRRRIARARRRRVVGYVSGMLDAFDSSRVRAVIRASIDATERHVCSDIGADGGRAGRCETDRAREGNEGSSEGFDVHNIVCVHVSNSSLRNGEERKEIG
ncbi:hypothetical protein EYF80_010216 [Liparis tanakae]|uniref:Uncharacterized protein n=1 Tax=Liparis tanakae TaxID=230148 RepID=A0A4Z2IQ45_9TELE|nr:hypothetical protein EYF80_010216 [Liparis tanakae]